MPVLPEVVEVGKGERLCQPCPSWQGLTGMRGSLQHLCLCRMEAEGHHAVPRRAPILGVITGGPGPNTCPHSLLDLRRGMCW